MAGDAQRCGACGAILPYAEEIARLRAENERLRAALTDLSVTDHPPHYMDKHEVCRHMAKMAREALEGVSDGEA